MEYSISEERKGINLNPLNRGPSMKTRKTKFEWVTPYAIPKSEEETVAFVSNRVTSLTKLNQIKY